MYMDNVKFKKGDRVRVIEHVSNSECIPLGSVGTVAEEDEMPWVVMDDKNLNTEDVQHLGIKAYVFIQDELELLESEVSNG